MVKKKEELAINENILICDFEIFKRWITNKKLNPLEKTMGIELLTHNYSFFPQYKIDLSEGTVVNGRKYFIVDFYLPEWNIIIETDGKIHLTEENQIKDRNKDNILTAMGYRVFRFDWNEIMKNNEDWDIFIMISNLISYTVDTDGLNKFKNLKEKALGNNSMPNFK